MQTSELYRQRAAECEKMALKRPEDRERYKTIAQTWRLLAKASDELSEAADTLH